MKKIIKFLKVRKDVVADIKVVAILFAAVLYVNAAIAIGDPDILSFAGTISIGMIIYAFVQKIRASK